MTLMANQRIEGNLMVMSEVLVTQLMGAESDLDKDKSDKVILKWSWCTT